MIDPATIPKVGPTTIPRWLTWSCLALVTAAVLWVCLPLGSTSIAVPDIAADTTAPTSISQTAALDVEAFRAPVWVAPPPVAAAAPLSMLPTAANPHVVPLPAAIQAVRDTEARVRDHYALSGRALREVGEAVRNSTLTDTQKVDVIAGVLANGPLDDAPGGPCEEAVFAARREAFREAEAWIRDRGSWRTFRFRFLSPDNPEGNA